MTDELGIVTISPRELYDMMLQINNTMIEMNTNLNNLITQSKEDKEGTAELFGRVKKLEDENSCLKVTLGGLAAQTKIQWAVIFLGISAIVAEFIGRIVIQ